MRRDTSWPRRALGVAIACMLLACLAGSNADAASGRCDSSQLSVRLGRGGVATGSQDQVVTFTNTSRSTCTLYGFPGLQMLGGTGHPITTHLHQGASFAFPLLPKRLVTLGHGAHASFEAGWADGTGINGATCPKATMVEITPPGADRPIAVRWRLQPYGRASQAPHCGIVTVSPVYPGTGRAVASH